VNTGWTGGSYGTGHRISIHHTRTLLNSALEGRLEDIPTVTDPFFGLNYPVECPGVPKEVLTPRDSWEEGDAYDAKARELVKLFRENFRPFERDVDEATLKDGPPPSE
jgi:phosphoenolpyruvate carboxykinase (ATP)